MNYKRIYEEFIRDRLNKQPEKPVYFEKHHILPRALGGGNEPSNIIRLTAEDHIHAHILLAKIYGGKMWGAVTIMSKKTVGCKKSPRKTPTKPMIALIGFARRMYSKYCRGENHHMYGRKASDTSRNKMSIAHKLRASKGVMWTQNNKELISGQNHWTKKKENSEALVQAIPIFKANLKRAILANTGLGNVMHRPEVAAKIGAVTKASWESRTGLASDRAMAKKSEARRKEEYIKRARDRVLGENNPCYGMNGGMNHNSRRVQCVETGQIFNSVKEAVSFCGGDVTKAARTGGKAGGYTWIRIDQHASDGRVMKYEKNREYQTLC